MRKNNERFTFIRTRAVLAGPFHSHAAAHEYGKANLPGYRLLSRGRRK